MTESEGKENFFKDDPVFMKSFIGKTVTIETTDLKRYTGVVYVIDPVSKTTVLDVQTEDKRDTVFVLYHAIKSLEINSDVVDTKYLECTLLQPKANVDIRKKLAKWLTRLYVNVEENGDCLKVDDHLVIVPPYGPENCISNNTIILDRIRKIISLMPREFK